MGFNVYYLKAYYGVIECPYESKSFLLSFSKDIAIVDNPSESTEHEFIIEFKEYEGIYRLTYNIKAGNLCCVECTDSKSKLLIDAPANIKLAIVNDGLDEFVDEYLKNVRRLIMNINKE